MPAFGRSSRERLETCDPRIQEIMNEVVKYFDCSILEGTRTLETQKEYVRSGRSKTMNSKHLSNPSKAVDVAPYPIDWDDTNRFYYFAGFVMAVAAQKGIKLRFGGDWNQDKNLDDQTFNDLVHFELVD